MKRVRDCLQAPVIPEAKLVLVAMTAGRLMKVTLMEMVDLLEETVGTVSYAFESLRVAKINVSASSGECVLASEWAQPEVKNDDHGTAEHLSQRN